MVERLELDEEALTRPVVPAVLHVSFGTYLLKLPGKSQSFLPRRINAMVGGEAESGG